MTLRDLGCQPVACVLVTVSVSFCCLPVPRINCTVLLPPCFVLLSSTQMSHCTCSSHLYSHSVLHGVFHLRDKHTWDCFVVVGTASLARALVTRRFDGGCRLWAREWRGALRVEHMDERCTASLQRLQYSTATMSAPLPRSFDSGHRTAAADSGMLLASITSSHMVAATTGQQRNKQQYQGSVVCVSYAQQHTMFCVTHNDLVVSTPYTACCMSRSGVEHG